jgi:hypothetical protein
MCPGGLLLLSLVGVAQPQGNETHCGNDFCTWWHNSGEVNTLTPVQPANVRQSRRYLVQIGKAGANEQFSSFVYESIPRNGNGRIYSPWDTPNSDTFNGTDGVSIEPSANITMAWSHFEYSVDVDITVSRIGVQLAKPPNVTIRPLALGYSVRPSADGGIIIHVPHDSNGRKFSVEFNDDLYHYRSNGKQYVPAPAGEEVSIEPRNALLIFASPFLLAGNCYQ